MENMTFKLDAVEIPTGTGRVYKIVKVESKISIIQVRNYDTMCLARSIVVGLAVRNKEKLRSIFKGNLRDAELEAIDKGRQIKTKINDSIISESENDT
jgi:hypothetical protein